jgi:hypothetical protein
MLVDLTTLKPNPLRDFQVDPIDPDAIAPLKASIEAHGFWGGVGCRRALSGAIEVAAGHHRVQAAIEAGITHADLLVRTDIDDEEMVRIYATENGLQRGGQSTAAAGMVLSAVRVIAKRKLNKFLTWSSPGKNLDLAAIHRNFTRGNGVGGEAIYNFLHHFPDDEKDDEAQPVRAAPPGQKHERIPGMTQEAIQEQLRNLKASGDYGRIIAAVVTDVLGEDQTEITLPVEEKTFDFEGVAKHLKNPHQIRAFRETVTAKGIQPHLPVSEQAALAADVVAYAQENGLRELTGAFVHEHIVHVKLQAGYMAFAEVQKTHDELMAADVQQKAEFYMREFSRHLSGAGSYGVKLSELYQDWPKEIDFPMATATFLTTLHDWRTVIDQIDDTFRGRVR